MKGHTKIELRDAKTGELVQAVEDGNMVTNALAEVFKPIFGASVPMMKMMFSNAPMPAAYDRFNNNLIRMLAGGLLLFDKAIEEDPDIIYKPSGVNNVGAGIEIAYTGTNPYLGSFNVLESQTDHRLGYVRYVWDFNSSQGNGTVACACLTTKQGGRCTAGVGQFDTAVEGKWFDPDSGLMATEALYNNAGFAWVLGQSGATGGNVNKWLYGNYDGNYVLQLNNPNIFNYSPADAASVFRTKSVVIDKYRYPFSNISLFDYKMSLISSANSSNVYTERLIDSYTVEMPQEMQDLISDAKLTSIFYYPNSFSLDKTHAYFSFFNPVSAGSGAGQVGSYAPNDDMLFWDIDLSDMTSSILKVKNTTGETIQSYYQLSYAGTGYSYPIYVLQGHTLVTTTSGRMYVIDNTDNTDVRKVTRNGEEFNLGNPFSNQWAAISEGIERNGIFMFTNRNGNSPVYSLDLETAACTHICTRQNTFYYSSSAYRNFNFLDGYKGMFQVSGGSALSPLMPYFDPSLLITINNLPEPVVKTAALTMKVTYTLTDGMTA